MKGVSTPSVRSQIPFPKASNNSMLTTATSNPTNANSWNDAPDSSIKNDETGESRASVDGISVSRKLAQGGDGADACYPSVV
jgi:hypothetical protein